MFAHSVFERNINVLVAWLQEMSRVGGRLNDFSLFLLAYLEPLVHFTWRVAVEFHTTRKLQGWFLPHKRIHMLHHDGNKSFFHTSPACSHDYGSLVKSLFSNNLLVSREWHVISVCLRGAIHSLIPFLPSKMKRGIFATRRRNGHHNWNMLVCLF